MRGQGGWVAGALAGLVLAIGVCAPAAAADLTATLTIHIANASPEGGILRLGLYDQANYAKDIKATATADVKAEPGETIIVLNNIKPGVYAIEMYQDVNGNDKMDTTWLGLPEEPFGFSRDARPHLSKPGFDRVKFTLNPGPNEQTIHLQNSISLIAAE